MERDYLVDHDGCLERIGRLTCAKDRAEASHHRLLTLTSISGRGQILGDTFEAKDGISILLFAMHIYFISILWLLCTAH